MFKERCVWLTYLEDVLKRDVFLMCHNRQSENAMIDGTMIEVLRKTIRFSKRHKKVALIIQTPGGNANEAFYICKFFREYYESVDTYIVGDCYSGGTIIALSSDNIYMNRNACLGPIDIQIWYDEKRPWGPGLYGMVNALDKGLKESELSPELYKALRDKPAILASYFKVKYSYKDIVGEYIKKHCISEESYEKIWNYMAELNFSHGSSLTYTRCIELGLNVKRMPKKLDEIVSRIVRDAEEEFGGLFCKSALCDFYENPNGSIIKTTNLVADDSYGISIEMSISKSTEKLGIIETSQAGYIQEMDIAITTYGVMPVSITPVKVGWREEYNTILTLPEQNQQFEDYINASVMYSLESSGVPAGTVISKGSFDRLRAMTKKNCYDSVLEILQKEGMDLDSMSSGEKWKAVVEYCLEEERRRQEEEDNYVMERIMVFVEKDALEQGVDYDSLTDVEKETFFNQVLENRVPDLAKAIDASEAELRSLDKEELYELIIDYLLEFEGAD